MSTTPDLCLLCHNRARTVGLDYVWLYPSGHVLRQRDPLDRRPQVSPLTFCGQSVAEEAESTWYELPVLKAIGR